MSERQIVIVAYKPKPGKEEELLQLTREHLPFLRERALATDRAAVACQGSDGTIVEVFEWEAGAMEEAHNDLQLQALWKRYAEACDYRPLNTLAEAAQIFATFKPLQL